MTSLARPSFWRAYEQLPAETKAEARRAYARFVSDPSHPSLRFKKLAGYIDVWSVRISAKYRAIGQRQGSEIIWVWIGSHNDFDKLFG